MNTFSTRLVTDSDSIFYKIVFWGIQKAGKTSIIRRILDLDFNPIYSPTIGFRYYNLDIKLDKNYSIQLWDISGDSTYYDYIPFFLRNTDVMVLVFDYKNKESQIEIINLYNNSIQYLSSKQIIVVGNKHENVKRDIPKTIEKWLKELEITVYPISAKENQGVSLLLQNVLNIVKERINDQNIK